VDQAAEPVASSDADVVVGGRGVYSHLLEGDKRAAAESMSQALFGG
jgi:hypothetical protein